MSDWPQKIRSLLAGSRLEPTREAEIVDELAQHLNDAYDDALMSGLSPEEAERVAMAPLKNGSLGASLRPVERTSHPAPAPGQDKGKNFLASVWHDLRFGGRLLRLNPLFAAVAILSLALGFGANTTIFQCSVQSACEVCR